MRAGHGFPLAVTAVLACACTASSSSSEPSVQASRVTSTRTPETLTLAPETSTTATATSVMPPAEPRAADWRLVRQWDRGDPDSFGTYDGTYIVLVASPSTGPGYSSVETSGGVELIHHDPGTADWQTQDGWLSPYAAVFMDINLPRRVARLTVYSLPSGELSAWSEDGSMTGVSPDANVSRDTLAYFTGRPETGMCLHVVDLQTMRDRESDCGDQREILGDVEVKGSNVFVSHLRGVSQPARRCKTVGLLDLTTGQSDAAAERAVNRQSDCLAWSGTRFDGGWAWDVANPNSPDIATAHGFARLDSGRLIDLGVMETDSMLACGDHLYWSMLQGEVQELVEWNHVSGAGIVLDSGPDAIFTSRQCSDDRWLTTRVDGLSGHDEKLRLIALDTSKRT